MKQKILSSFTGKLSMAMEKRKFWTMNQHYLPNRMKPAGSEKKKRRREGRS